MSRYHLVQRPDGRAQRYCGGIDAESLFLYEPGGYHPVELGDVMNNGRYKILHKLGWGSVATTWAAKDQKRHLYVAIKIMMSKVEGSRELNMLRALSALPKDHPGSSYVCQMLDHFTHVGPNGTHTCLVLELVGPNVAEFVDCYGIDNRLPVILAKLFAKQTLQGLDFLATNNIGHGDLHTQNLAIVVPGLDALSEEDFIATLGDFVTGAVTKIDHGPWAPNVPTEMIRPAIFREEDVLAAPCPSIKIIDFGEAFFSDDAPSTLNNPFVLRAPEIFFKDRLDLRVDLWTAGCLIFELVCGIPPIDAGSPLTLVRQMIATTSEELPSRWQAQWRDMQQGKVEDDGGLSRLTLKEWLVHVYFKNHEYAELTMEEIECVTKAIAGLLRLEPSLRATARESLSQEWFQ
ncbi:hypothetical protein E4U22_003895 [Claviceps purpurea]|nr:hypothetical protein E4U22_003895 [Claviceps purpurea]